MNKHRNKQTTMAEFNEEVFGKGVKGNIFIPDTTLIGVNSSKKDLIAEQEKNNENLEQQEEAILKYNKEIVNLDEDYTNFEPFQDFIIARAFHIEPTFNLMPDGTKFYTTEWRERRIILESGSGVKETIKSEYQFQAKMVIVSISPFLHIPQEVLKVGDIVQPDKGIILPNQQGIREGIDNVMVNSFTLPEYTSPIAPTNITNKHFGYFVFSRDYILGKLKSA